MRVCEATKTMLIVRVIILHMQKGKFITFEGPDGSGKTTVSTAVVEKLKEAGIPVLYSREPGGSAIAEQIRDVILDPKNTAMDARTEALLYAASRRQHLKEIIEPALDKGINVICDRFIDSSLAYQGYGRHIGEQEVYQINEFAIESHMPDKTIFLKISAEEGLSRIQNRSFLDRLDQESITFHDDVFNGYEKVVEKYKDRMIIVDASKEVDAVIEDAYKAVMEILNA